MTDFFGVFCIFNATFDVQFFRSRYIWTWH